MTSLTQREAIFMDKPDFLSVIPGLLCSKLLLRFHLQQEVRKIVISEHETLQVSVHELIAIQFRFSFC